MKETILGIFIMVSGVLFGLSAALVTVRVFSNSGNSDIQGFAWFLALLTFVGVSATTVGVGVLVMRMGRV